MDSILVISYTETGWELNEQIRKHLETEGYCCIQLQKPKGHDFLGKYWSRIAGVIFVGAMGIAVRLTAPYVKDKLTDPAVLVADEKGSYVIPVLSGHVGGANALAIGLAEKLHGQAVLTTATDVQGAFAVDAFAKKAGLLLADRELAKWITAAVLRGEPIGFYSGYPVKGRMPKDLRKCQETGELKQFIYGIVVDEVMPDEVDIRKTLLLRPVNLVVGMGCRKECAYEELRTYCQETLARLRVSKEQVAKLVSIDLKADETGLLQLAEEFRIPFVTYSKEKLSQVEAVSSESGFVRQITGVGNVCERAAVLGSGFGRLLLPKTASRQMTIAVAKTDWSVEFE